jgi:DNA polymerase III epsilon subunit family exonuclease
VSRQNPHDQKNGPGHAHRNGGSGQRRGQKRRRKPQVGGPAPDAASLLSVRSSLLDAEYIVFDIETTGGNPEKNGITEIFAVKYKNGEPGETFYSLVNPQIPIPPIVRRMTGINNQTVRDAPLIAQVMPGFVEYAGNGILVSHNTIGDMKFLRHFAKEVCDIEMGNFFLCTHLLVEKLAKEAPDKSLRGLAEHFKLDSGDLHRAEADAYVTLDLFKVLMGKLLERKIVLVEEAIRLQGDLDSGVRLGWGIPPESLENVPQQPGVFHLLDLEKKVLFASSSYHLEREIKKIRLFDQLPRGLLRVALKSYDIKYDPQPTFFAAMLAESHLLEKQKLAFDPFSWHQRLMFGVMFVKDPDGHRMFVGNFEPGVTIAIGPVRDRRQASEYVEAVAGVFQKEVTKAGVLLAPDEFSIIKSSLCGDLKPLIDTEKRKRKSLKMWFSPSTRKVLDTQIHLMESLTKIQPLPRAEMMLNKTGVLAVGEGKNRGNWSLYPIEKGRPLEPFSLKGDLDGKLREPKQLANLKDRLSAAKIGDTVQAGETHKINAALWMIYNGRSESRFFPLAELEKDKVETSPPARGP